ncbi:hypothetical protein EIP86_005828 [Pleurotus ostreatoroseus]|nr:hypothetical protein EIP86_005828 [Pleurotus ostreatoroseus]
MFVLIGLQDPELTLGFLGNTFDIINPIRVPVDSSENKNPLATATSSLNNTLVSFEQSSTSHSWPPYYDTSSEFFNNTFVVSLPSRMDRRVSMERLRQYISANWTYVDAVNAEDKEISWILECIRSMREGGAASTPTEEFVWPQEFDPNPDVSHIDSLSNETFSWCPRPDTSTGSSPGIGTIGQRPELRPLTCATRNLTDGPPYSVALPPYMVLTPSKIACWRSHIQILERFASENTLSASSAHEIALILEDDVDMERDIRKRLHDLWANLSRVDWDMVFLVQRKVTASDVDAGDSGVGSAWRDSLDDGILAA